MAYIGKTLSPHVDLTSRVNYSGESTEGRCIPSTNDWRGGGSREEQGLRRREAKHLVY